MSCHQQQLRSLPSLNETYKKSDKKPFGSYVAYNRFATLFNDKFIETTIEPFDVTWDNIKNYSSSTQYSIYFLVAKNISLTSTAAIAMANFVKEGNDLFIAADYIDMQLQAQLDFLIERDTEIAKEVHGYMHPTSVRIDFGKGFKAPAYGYYYYPFLNYFDSYDSAHTRVLGVNEDGKPNYIVIFIGNGRLYLHAAPRVFSNYFLLTGNNYQYLDNVLSYLRFEPKNIYWDEYYKGQDFTRKKRRSGGINSGDDDTNKFSPLNVIKNNPPLLWAFWLAIIALILYVLVNIKRKQRVINEVKENTNTTVTFAETVGRLYLQKKNNNNIAEKMITYFYEHIRNSYFLNTTQVNNEFMNSLSRKSGVAIEDTQKLFNTIDTINAGKNVSDIDLLRLNELIQKFYKNKT
jgi:predicted nucleic acid-binding protein